MISNLLKRAVALLQSYVIKGRDGSAYLTRYTLANFGKRSFRVYVNHFHRSDEDHELHNHPWQWAASLILSGGYCEERRTDHGVDPIVFSPGMVNLIGPNTFHRVDLLTGDAWTLFIAGPVVQSWGFWDRASEAFTPWREFIAAKGLVPRHAWTPGGAS